ncbi:hypothetical protein ACLBXM_20100 [Xanthobacteraceae bacterium A53D]
MMASGRVDMRYSHLMADITDLTDEQAHDRLVAAREALGDAAGTSTAANTALEAARKALVLLQLGLVGAMERRDRSAERQLD